MNYLFFTCFQSRVYGHWIMVIRLLVRVNHIGNDIGSMAIWKMASMKRNGDDDDDKNVVRNATNGTKEYKASIQWNTDKFKAMINIIQFYFLFRKGGGMVKCPNSQLVEVMPQMQYENRPGSIGFLFI